VPLAVEAQLRLKKGLTQTALAPSLAALERLAKALSVPVTEVPR